MFRRCLTTMLAVLLAVMLPVCALADRQHTLTVIPGDMLSFIEGVADLAEVLSLSVAYGDDSGALGVRLAEKDVLKLAASADTTGLYVNSNILSDEVLYITWEDGVAMLNQLLVAEMGEEAVASIRGELETEISKVMKTVQTPSVPIADADQGLEALKELLPDDPAMFDFVAKLMERVAVEEGNYVSDVRDTATGKVSMTMGAQDLLAVLETKTVRNALEELIISQDPQMSAADVNAAVNEMIAEAQKAFSTMQMDVTTTLYTAGEDEIVGLELDMPMTIEAEGQTVGFVMNAAYNRLTEANGVSYRLDLNMGVPEQANGMISMVFDLYRGYDELSGSKGMFAVLAAGQQFTITYDATTENNARTRLAGIYLRSNAAAVVEPAASERPLITFKVVSSEADPAVLAAVKNASPETAVNVLKLSEEGMNALVNGIQMRFFQIYSDVMTNLPASALSLLVGNAE